MLCAQVKDGDWVGVTVTGVAKPTTSDALAIYLQDPADPTVGINRLIKYKWANADPAYISSGKTSFRSVICTSVLWHPFQAAIIPSRHQNCRRAWMLQLICYLLNRKSTWILSKPGCSAASG